jgi:hypothetical protein
MRRPLNIAHLDGFDYFAGYRFRIFLLNQLRKDAFEVGQFHELGQFGRAGVGQYFAFRYDHNAATNLLHDFENMRERPSLPLSVPVIDP